MSKSTYWQRLKNHPGVLPAAIFTVIGALAGGWGGAVIMSVWWIPVLITARTQPVPGETNEH